MTIDCLGVRRGGGGGIIPLENEMRMEIKEPGTGEGRKR